MQPIRNNADLIRDRNRIRAFVREVNERERATAARDADIRTRDVFKLIDQARNGDLAAQAELRRRG